MGSAPLGSVEDALTGAVTFIQRADSSLRLNVHYHSLVLDGVYVEDEAGELQFHSLGDPTSEEVAQVAQWTHAQLKRVLERHGRSLDGCDDTPDVLAQEQLALAMCYEASAGDKELLGDTPGQRTRKLAFPVREVAEPKVGEAVAEVGGVNVHAGRAIDGRDRRRLERLCRYVARPPVAQKWLSVASSGQVSCEFKRAWKDGTHAVVLDPLDFIARLAALIPPPNSHMLRYHGVLAAHSKARAEVVPGPRPEPPEPAQLRLVFEGESTELEPGAKRDSRHPLQQPRPWVSRCRSGFDFVRQ